MSTQSCTRDQPATSQHDTRRPPRPHRGQPSWYAIAIAIGAVAAAALIVLAATGLWSTPSLVETRFSPDAFVWVTVVFHGTVA